MRLSTRNLMDSVLLYTASVYDSLTVRNVLLSRDLAGGSWFLPMLVMVNC